MGAPSSLLRAQLLLASSTNREYNTIVFNSNSSRINDRWPRSVDGFNIKSIITRLYGDKGRYEQKVYGDLDELLPNMTNRSIASFMQRISRDKHRFQREDLMKIVQRLVALPDRMDMIPLSQLMNSLRIYDDKDEAVLYLIEAITQKVRKSKLILDSQAIGNMLYGLQRMRSDSPEVRALLRDLTPLVKTCKEPLKAQNVGNMLYGLKGMSSDCPDFIERVNSISEDM